VKSYELGLKTDLLDRLVTLNIAGFLSRYRNLQETATITSGTVVRQIVTNAAKSKVKGIELAMTIRPLTSLTLMSNVAYLSSRYADYPNAPCTTTQQALNPVCVQDLSGARRAFAPKFSGNIGANFTQPVGGDYEISFDANAYFTSRFLQLATGDYRISQAGNTKIDARIGFGPADGRWELAIVGKNLTNRLTAGYRQVVPGAAGSLAALADAPRSIGLQGSFRL
jgi:outer membrane receptor protein involved in Fe transport